MKISLFEKKLQEANSLEELESVLEQELLKFEITTFSFTYYSYRTHSLSKIKYDFCSANYLAWHEYYIEQNYQDADSTFESQQQTNLPVFWDINQQLQIAKTPREKQMRLDSLSFGVSKGLSIPIYGPQENFANFLVVQMQNEHCLDDWQNKQYNFFLLGHCFYHYLQDYVVTKQALSENCYLTQREMQCLMYTAKRFSAKEIGKKLNISERTVNFHLQKIIKKLGVRNKHQAVTKAVEKHLLQL